MKIGFSSRLNELMSKNGVSSYELAGYLKVSEELVRAWRRDDFLLSLSTAVRTADYFDVSLDYITGRSNVAKRV